MCKHNLLDHNNTDPLITLIDEETNKKIDYATRLLLESLTKKQAESLKAELERDEKESSADGILPESHYNRIRHGIKTLPPSVQEKLQEVLDMRGKPLTFSAR